MEFVRHGEFWDLHVPGAEHYAAQGLWHHNSGKSFAGAAKVLARIGRRELGTVYAPTYPMLRDATQRTLLAMLDGVGVPYVWHKTEQRIEIPRTGHEILCRSLDNPDSLRGPNLHYAWVDEASLVPREGWNVVIGRVRVGDHPQAWATFTPKGRNWCWEIWERDADPDHPLYRVRTDENPELPPDFGRALGYSGRFAEQELGGQFVAFEGLVYPAFSRPQHVHPCDVAGWRTVLGVDVGTRNPTAILTIHAASDDRRHVSRELYRRGMSSDEIVAAVAAEYAATGAETAYLDPSAAGYIASLVERGVHAVKADNDVLKGIGVVTSALAAGFTIHPSCANTIAEFESYRYPEHRRNDDKPLKEGVEHAMDAMRYGLMGLDTPAPTWWMVGGA